MGDTPSNVSTFPERVGPYELLVPVASGGMATVYLARQRGAGGFEREVALKLTHAALGDGPDATYELVEEAKLASRIRHPNVVAVLDAGEDPNGVFLVMEYVEGDTLAGLLRAARRGERDLPMGIALRVLCDGLAGLHAAHELRSADGAPLGLVHRDFSPQNLLVGIDGVGRLSDFGIAKAIGRAGLTRAGTIKGKLGYMSPEQVRGRTLDRRSDVWAAAVVTWELLTRKRLFTAPDQREILFKIVSESPPRIRSVNVDVPPQLDDAVASALVRDPNGRLTTADDLRRRIEDACVASGVKIASTSEVSAFMEESLAVPLSERRAAVAKARALRSASADEPTEVDATFVHRARIAARERPRRRWAFAAAALALAALAAVAARATLTKDPMPKPSATATAAAEIVTAPVEIMTTAPSAPPATPLPVKARAVASPRRTPPSSRSAETPRAAPEATTRSPFHNPYEDTK